MSIDITTPYSPGWWLARLTGKLEVQRVKVDKLDRYFKGEHDLPSGNEAYASKWRAFQRIARTNYLSLVVEAPLERMQCVGFRSSNEAVSSDEIWSTWQKTHLDADQTHVYRTMLSLGVAYVMVGDHPRKTGQILITPEHPSNVITEAYEDDAREVRAGLKMWDDDVTGRTRANVYLADYTYRFESGDNPQSVLGVNMTRKADNIEKEWKLIGEPVPNRLGIVPIVAFGNRSDGRGNYYSEFEDVINVQDRINLDLFNRMVAEQAASFRQRVILNLDLGEPDEDGNVAMPHLPNDPMVTWLLDGDNLSFFEFSQTNTANMLTAVESDIRDLAAITRTPPHYLLSAIVNASGDTLKAAETGLVAKVKERSSQAAEAWEQVMALACKLNGQDVDVSELQTQWSDPESRTVAELYDAAVKAVTAGVPFAARMELLGYTPQDVKRFETERTKDAMIASLSAPIGPTNPVISTGDSQGPLVQEGE